MNLKLNFNKENNFQDIPFDGTFNVMAINGILNNDNIYNFALKLNREQGLKINVVDENTKITKDIMLGKIINNNIYCNRMIINKIPWCIICDYLRLMLICDYGFNNFIDLDLILNKEILNLKLEEYAISKKNDSAFLMHNELAKEQYLNLKKNIKDNIFISDAAYYVKSKIKILNTYFYLNQSFQLNTLINEDYYKNFEIVVIDKLDKKLFDMNKKRHIKIINWKNFNKQNIFKFFNNNFDKKILLNTKYIDIEGNELKLK